MAGPLDFLRKSKWRKALSPTLGHNHGGGVGAGGPIAFVGTGIIVPNDTIDIIADGTSSPTAGLDTGWTAVDIGTLPGGPVSGAKAAIIHGKLYVQHGIASARNIMEFRKFGTAPVKPRFVEVRYLMIGDPDDNDDQNSRTVIVPLDANQKFEYRIRTITNTGGTLFYSMHLEGWIL